MPFSGTKKSPLISVPFLKKRLRRITALGLYNLTVNEFYFSLHFTLHRNEKTVAFYTSESVVNQRSPEWCYLQFPTNVQCLQEFIMRVWITSGDHSRLFLEYDIHLNDSLVPDEQKNKVNKDNNSLWLEMFGYRFTDNDEETNVQENDEETISIDKKKRISLAKSYSKLSIIRMNNVIHAIRSEKQASLVYLQRIQTFVDENKDYLSKIKERESRELYIENLKNYLQYQTYLYQQRLNAYHQRQKHIAERRSHLNHNLAQLLHQQEDFRLYTNNLDQLRSILRNLTQIISYRQKEIMNEIYRYIYPIRSDNQLEYYIANCRLPQADDKIYQSPSNREHDNEIAAAMGNCSHLILIISQVIQLPLRFPIHYHGASAPKIYDYTLEINEFPLYPTTTLSDFRYGFYLLNRNIGQIMYHCQLNNQNTDFRNTLENLKELIEEYFIKSNTNNQIPLYPSLQTTKSMNNDDDEAFVYNKQTSDVSSSFLSSCSSTSSLIENGDYDQVNDLEFFSELQTNKPRLAMQISHQ
ncbi:unnamed protein product [Rotaria magnacalcarata]|uniref:Uncharacterized protein n=1 Tax=Rotaria magnacalcarata TaxID=392030 RepID=A0A815MTB1_9BILA|nr:unnamed protein product [Rotaria magnacalcarata]CAF1471538.1 unnamed protein product [Rotaria magnacalcarata]CAF2037192.1 unnamed protein product [Rotaria magnacalcarata]CAF2045238.1 unnamed protein product [Rotaria magnacalcarata]CAF4006575.1 unnamed protein product [Rotaria magnacalcarata]